MAKISVLVLAAIFASAAVANEALMGTTTATKQMLDRKAAKAQQPSTVATGNPSNEEKDVVILELLAEKEGDEESLRALEKVEDDIFFSKLAVDAAKTAYLSAAKTAAANDINIVHRRRHRRAIWGIAARGAAWAAGRAISGARKLFSNSRRSSVQPRPSGSRQTRQYDSSLTHDQAVREFRNLRLPDAATRQTGRGTIHTGTLGKHKVTVRPFSKEGRPTVEIRSPRPGGRETVRKFRLRE